MWSFGLLVFRLVLVFSPSAALVGKVANHAIIDSPDVAPCGQAFAVSSA
jgi:hypothetical protein